jgi:hypothetical protein
MEEKELSLKAKVVLAALELLEAKGESHKVNSYTILDAIINNEDLAEHQLIKGSDELELNDIIIDANIKSINTLITSLVRKGFVGKTEPTSISVEGTTRNLRHYYLK